MATRVLFLCTHNSARSQMAEALLRDIAGEDFDVYSAGTHPWIVRPGAIEAMAEIGLDISSNRSKSVKEFLDKHIDYVLTVCDNARSECPVFPARTITIHHPFEDPVFAEGDIDARRSAFRRVRDALSSYIADEFIPLIKQKENARKHSR